MKHKIELVSFGFKYGKPSANVIFDVSFLKNPKYGQDHIWYLTDEMRERLLSDEKTIEFLEHLIPFIEFISQQTDTVIGLGCTGGHHRSPGIAEEIARQLRKKGYSVGVTHKNAIKRNKND